MSRKAKVGRWLATVRILCIGPWAFVAGSTRSTELRIVGLCIVAFYVTSLTWSIWNREEGAQ